MAEELPEIEENQNDDILANAPISDGNPISNNQLLIIIGIVAVVVMIAAGISLHETAVEIKIDNKTLLL